MLKKRVQMDSIKNSWKYEKDLIIFNTIGAIFPIPKWLQSRANILRKPITQLGNSD